MDSSNLFESIESVHEKLIFLSGKKNIVNDLRNTISWDYQTVISVSDLKDDLDHFVLELRNAFMVDIHEKLVNELIRCFVHYELYDNIISTIRKKFAKDDLHLYNYSKQFCKNNGTPKQLGSTFYNFIPNAAVVELSMITNRRTPMEKLNFLRSAYDYIFVEVKGALISVISKYSEKESDMPIINNKEVIPIVMAVILKSKLFYFISDMYDIEHFGENILHEDQYSRDIFYIYKDALNRIINFDISLINNQKSLEKLDVNLSVCDAINFVESVENNEANNKTVFQEETRRVATLIKSATTEDLQKYT